MYVVIAQDIMVVRMFLFTYTIIPTVDPQSDSPPQLQCPARQFVGYNVNNMFNIFQVVSLAVPIGTQRSTPFGF